ncbi:thioredoxin family protein [Thalassotalea insulae]|uniref:Thioredoxin family protein n=1 Tax=Thalassotalea insulae TaxID=2056778 RepID=A0ABQ6H1X4_9GAMM|nr:glutaredoxin family protein [Thalassotalea insulae]GLX80421.1 thioredoxin family protein [Thalassotalea insulae]
MAQFTLYSSEGCHLCEQALVLCRQAGIEERLTVTDIVNNEHLAERYGMHIPVLERQSDNRQLFWPFSLVEIKELVG